MAEGHRSSHADNGHRSREARRPGGLSRLQRDAREWCWWIANQRPFLRAGERRHDNNGGEYGTGALDQTRPRRSGPMRLAPPNGQSTRGARCWALKSHGRAHRRRRSRPPSSVPARTSCAPVSGVRCASARIGMLGVTPSVGAWFTRTNRLGRCEWMSVDHPRRSHRRRPRAGVRICRRRGHRWLGALGLYIATAQAAPASWSHGRCCAPSQRSATLTKATVSSSRGDHHRGQLHRRHAARRTVCTRGSVGVTPSVSLPRSRLAAKYPR
jgi:hypothetical protein